jgi:hypothetical protein
VEQRAVADHIGLLGESDAAVADSLVEALDMAFIVNSPASAIAAMWWRRR